MKLIPLPQLLRDFDFAPVQKWPNSMPCYALNGQLLCGFERTAGHAIELNGSLADLFPLIHPHLKLSELARLLRKLQEYADRADREQLFQRFGFRLNDRNLQFFHVLNKLPQSFLDWCDEKSPGVNDLSILFSFENLEDLFPIMLRVQKLSKSSGMEALELAGELILMGKNNEVNMSLNEGDSTQWIKYLRRLRYPILQHDIQTQDQKIQNIPWPKNTSANLHQQGDQNIIEVKIQATSFSDFSAKLEKLKSLSDLQKDDWL